MLHLDTAALGDRLHRLVKLAMDTGEAADLDEAQRIFSSYRLAIAIGPEVAHSAAHQAALLTMVNSGDRSLLGGVEIAGLNPDTPCLLPLPHAGSLADAVRSFGGRVVVSPTPGIPLVLLGDASFNGDAHPLALRTTFSGWCGGVAPVASGIRLDERDTLVIAAVLAGALTITEIFQFLRRSNAAAGRRGVGLSLWRPECDWRDPAALGPRIERLPSAAWLIGLGNLGQAYLWTLSLLPYATPAEVCLVLQDFDFMAPSNLSTSLLTTGSAIGQKKTRATAAWAEQRGFRTVIIERPFAANFRVMPDEPPVALCGVDNAQARACLEDVGFSRVIESGLGKGTSDFLALRLHCFPGPKPARTIWNETGAADAEGPKLDLPAYQALAANGADRCGLTSLAGRTVGAPFVGAIAATLVIAELVRLANGAHTYDFMDGHLRALDKRTVALAAQPTLVNPGTTRLGP
ncbi:MAG TPA: hypothetical protein VHE09_02055 [Rhizomicrobium sp.]|nr:hypothetical protein [Rhizomicrobium sp.]